MSRPEQDRLPRRELLVRSIKRGAAVVGAVVAAGGVGNWYGSSQERQKHVSRGDLTPELEGKLVNAGYFIYEPKGETVASMRNAGLDISPFPLTLPEGQPDFENVASKRRWIAIKPDEFYLPGNGDVDVRGALGGLVRSRQLVLQRQFGGNEIQFVPGEVVDLLGLYLRYRLTTGGEGLFDEGFIITANKIGNNGVAIGRDAPGEPLRYSIFDASTQNPTPPPDRLQAAGIIVAK